MKMKMYFLAKLIVVSGLLVTISARVGAQTMTLYQNTSEDSGAYLGLANGATIGDEIVMDEPYDINISSFSFELYGTSSDSFSGVTLEVELLENNGTPYDGYATPDTQVYSTTLTSANLSGLNGEATVNITGLSGVTPSSPDFTLAVEVQGLTDSDTLGVELFDDPPTIGQNYGEYWDNNGTTSWTLYYSPTEGGYETDFGAEFTGTATPEPSVTTFGALGVGIISFMAFLRRKRLASAR